MKIAPSFSFFGLKNLGILRGREGNKGQRLGFQAVPTTISMGSNFGFIWVAGMKGKEKEGQR